MKFMGDCHLSAVHIYHFSVANKKRVFLKGAFESVKDRYVFLKAVY